MSNHLILCYLLLLSPSIIPSIRVFSKKSALRIKWPKYWSFSFSNSPSNDYSELISFRMDWFDLLAPQGTPKSLLQNHSSKASVLFSAYFMVQFSHPYMTTGKTIVLSVWTFVGKVMPLPLNTLSRCVITFLPRSKYILISWLQSHLHVALSILWIFGSLSLLILDLTVCAMFLPRSAPIISVVMKKVLSNVYEDNFCQFCFSSNSEIISWQMIKAYNLFFWVSWLLAFFEQW